MATIVKDGKKWRAQVCVKGKRASKSFLTKTEAKFWAADKELEIVGGRSIAASTRTVGDLFDRYADEVSPGKKGCDYEVKRLAAFKAMPIGSVLLDDFNSGHLAMWRDTRLRSVKTSTVNRELNLMSAVFTRSVREWKWLKSNPITDVQRPKNPKHRDRRISEAEVCEVIAALKYSGQIVTKSQLVACMFLFAIESGMRLGEICALRVCDLFEHHVVVRDSKNGDSRNVPLSSRARELVELILASGLSTDSDHAGQLFKKGCRKAGIEDLHFHDSRHEACTRLARRVDVLDLARIIGHRDLKSLMIYYNPSTEELSKRLG